MKACKKMIAALVISGLLGICMNGCGTVKGAGRDVESVGRGVERASDNAAHNSSNSQNSRNTNYEHK